MRDLLSASNDTYLVKCPDFGAQSSVNTENLPIYHGSKYKEVENLTTTLPNRGISIFLLTLFIKSINLGDLTGFVITSNKGDTVRVSEERLAVP